MKKCDYNEVMLLSLSLLYDGNKNKTTLFLNGKKINEKELKFSKSFPENYFSEELRTSGEILSGLRGLYASSGGGNRCAQRPAGVCG